MCASYMGAVVKVDLAYKYLMGKAEVAVALDVEEAECEDSLEQSHTPEEIGRTLCVVGLAA